MSSAWTPNPLSEFNSQPKLSTTKAGSSKIRYGTQQGKKDLGRLPMHTIGVQLVQS